MPDSRPSPVSAWIWPQMRKRSRIRPPILSRISARSPPVCRCRITAVTKNFRSRLGTRSARSAELSSRGMPRFCSSKTRPNSLPSGAGISVATRLKPKARLCPARSAAGQHFHGVGQLGGEGLQPPLPPPEDARTAAGSASTGRRRAARPWPPGAPMTQPPARPPPGSPREPASLRHGQRRVGLLEQQLEVAEAFEERLEQARPGSSGRASSAALLQQVLLGRRGDWRRSAGPAGPRCGLPACARSSSHHGAPPGGDAQEHGGGDHTAQIAAMFARLHGGVRQSSASQSPSSRAGGRRWRAAARRPSPAAS